MSTLFSVHYTVDIDSNGEVFDVHDEFTLPARVTPQQAYKFYSENLRFAAQNNTSISNFRIINEGVSKTPVRPRELAYVDVRQSSEALFERWDLHERIEAARMKTNTGSALKYERNKIESKRMTAHDRLVTEMKKLDRAETAMRRSRKETSITKNQKIIETCKEKISHYSQRKDELTRLRDVVNSALNRASHQAEEYAKQRNEQPPNDPENPTDFRWN